MKIVGYRDRITAVAAFFVCIVLTACSGSHGMAPPTSGVQNGVPGGRLHRAAASGSVEWVLPSFAYVSADGNGGSAGDGSQGLDAGVASSYVFSGEVDSGSKSAALLSDCPGKGAGGCQVYAYGDLTNNLCSAGYQANFVSWANSNDEDAFFHKSPGARTSANRMYVTNTKSLCGPYGGTNEEYFMNIMDPTAITWLKTNYWGNTAYIPTGWGQYEDDFGPGSGENNFCNGHNFVLCTTEYASPAPSSQWTNPGAGPYSVGQSNAQGYANWLNSTGLPMIVNGYDGGYCDASQGVSGGHCIGTFANGFANTQDNVLRLSEFCSYLTSADFYGFIAERAIYNGAFESAYRITSLINTASVLLANHASDNCRNIRLMDLEDPKQASTLRSYQTALRWMVPSNDGTPDFLLPWRYTYGPSNTEVAFFPDDTVVPEGPEETFSAYKFNGGTVTDGTGCPTAGAPVSNGDTGGAISEVVYCGAAGAPVLLIRYHHCYYAQSGEQIDEGPCAALLNTSKNPETIQPSWFTTSGDPFSTYTHLIDFNRDEWPNSKALYYAPGKSTNLQCTNPTYCNGSVDFSGTIPQSPSVPGYDAVFLIGTGPRLVQSAVGSPATQGTTVTETLSAAPAVGDVMTLCVGNSRNSTTWTAPSGWTLATNNATTACWDRVVQSGDGTSYTVTASASGSLVGEIAEWSGVNTSSPIDKASDVSHASGSGSYASGSLTPSVTGDLPVGWVTQLTQYAGTLSSSGNTPDPAGQINSPKGYSQGEMFYGAPLTTLSAYSMSASSTSTAAGSFILLLLKSQ